MRKILTVALLAYAVAASVVLACTPTLWTALDLSYNIGQLDSEAQNAPVLHLFSSRDGYGGNGQHASGFRYVCYQSAASAPTSCEDTMASAAFRSKNVKLAPKLNTPGPGPGPCYVVVTDWGQNQYGGDLTQAYCESIDSSLGIVVE